MKSARYFQTAKKPLKLPLFFPDATRAVIRALDSQDIKNTQTPGVLVNTYHLSQDLGQRVVKEYQGIGNFMSWDGAIISDSGGFQIMSLVKACGKKGKVTDAGVTFQPTGKKKIFFTPEDSIAFQMALKTDLLVVLDDFTEPQASYQQAKETVKRTILWAERSKQEFEKSCQRLKIPVNKRPYLIAVVQGGEYLDLRTECTKQLVKIGFDGLGYGGWPITPKGLFNYQVAKVIADNAPKDYLLYGLGIGKPEEIVGCVKLGFHLFDCVLPTRDARHGRLYVYRADSIKEIDVTQPQFYSFYAPDKEKYYHDTRPVSTACDCLLCTRYSRAYLAHLFRLKEATAWRLATIHNLRFYSLLMEKLQV